MNLAHKWMTFFIACQGSVTGGVLLYEHYELAWRGDLTTYLTQEERFGFPMYSEPEYYANVLLLQGSLYFLIGLLALYCYATDKTWIARYTSWIIATVMCAILLEMCWLTVRA